MAAALVPLVLVAASGPADGASQTWTVQWPPDVTAPNGSIQAMSCVTATLCTAVGNYDNSATVSAPLAQVWNGHSWLLQDTAIPTVSSGYTPGFTGVSCLSGQFCMAVGSTNIYALDGTSGFAETWNGTTWQLVPFAQPTGSIGSQLAAVSCVTADFCEAVGVYLTSQATYSLAELWDGSSWHVQPSPNQPGQYTETWLSGVSCASVTFCQATDSMGPLIAEWNGTRWIARTAPRDPELSSVSCESAVFCEAAGISGSSFIGERWNGTGWQAKTIVKLASGGQLNAVSCGSASFCEAVGDRQDGNPDGSDAGFAAVWNGTSWRSQSVPATAASDTSTFLGAVSCVSASYCEAGGSFPVQMDVWNGSAWTAQHALVPHAPTDNDLSGVSCLSATFCEAGGGADTNPSGLPEIWNGTSWKLQTNTSLYGSFSSVSCLSTTFCEATGQEFAQWNGTSWTTQPAYPAPGYQSVSCGSTTFCVAVGAYGASTWNGTTWTATTLPSASGPYTSVSCVSVTFCEAVAPNDSLQPGPGVAATWNGTSWAAQSVPGPAGSTELRLDTVSCTSATFCEVAGISGGNGISGGTAFTDQWNGSAWAEQALLPVPSGSSQVTPSALSCTSTASCTLVGTSTTTTAGPWYALIEGWNGASWTIENTSTTADSSLSGVSCLANGPCVAVGSAPKGPVTATWAEVSS
jgi:hypothetical protein